MHVMISDQIQLTDSEDCEDEESAGTSSVGREHGISTSTQEACQNEGNYIALK